MAKFVLTPEQFTTVAGLLQQAAGLYFDAGKLLSLQSHLRDRARAHHLGSFDDYLALLRHPAEGPGELQELIESVTIHETSFFRNQEHFKALNTVVFPALAASAPAPRPLRIWSAGCATGE